MRVLIACEYSGVVRDAFINMGHEAVSCDLLPTDVEGPHYKGDILDIINDGWDLMIAHPPCTYLTVSQAWTYHRPDKFPDRKEQQRESIEFFNKLITANIPKICVENPVPMGALTEVVGKYTQIVQPYMFGEDASKRTCLWLKGLEPLVPTDIITKKRYANQTPSGQNNLGPSKDRWKIRSKTYQGIADAMASQWGV